MKILIRWLLISLVIIACSYILPGVHVDNVVSAIVAAIVLSLLNVSLKPLLIILTLPINILTLGLFTLVINTIIILLTGALVPGLSVDGFFWALLFSIIISLANILIINND